MSGLVGEFTDDCIWRPGPAGGNWECAVRGGDYGSPPELLECAATTASHVNPMLGFRCCKDVNE